MKTLDVRGEICPYPMMRTVSALKKLASDDRTLEVVTDHAPALDTIPTQAARLGFETAWVYDHLAWRSFRDTTWFAAVPTLTK